MKNLKNMKNMKNLKNQLGAWIENKKQRGKEVLQNNKGMGIVEIALIIVIIVALAFVFKERIMELLKNIFDGIDINGLGSK